MKDFNYSLIPDNADKRFVENFIEALIAFDVPARSVYLSLLASLTSSQIFDGVHQKAHDLKVAKNFQEESAEPLHV